MTLVTRPVWRTFDPRFEANAVAHVRAGGLAVVRGDRWRVLLPCDEDGALGELAAWALLDLGLRALGPGPSPDVLAARLPRRLHDHVAAWCERDATQPASVAALALDCRACAACCRRNRVELGDGDEARWREAGRGDLAGGAYVRAARGGKRVLRVLASGDCVHLAATSDCRIYDLRPDNCRAFPAGSEGCLGARAEAGFADTPSPGTSMENGGRC